jgi:hypothetical protein
MERQLFESMVTVKIFVAAAKQLLLADSSKVLHCNSKDFNQSSSPFSIAAQPSKKRGL